MPCEPGPAPLMKLAQATGLCGGMLVPSLRNPLRRASWSRLGSRPAFIICRASPGSIPSMPITMTFFPAANARPFLRRAGRRPAAARRRPCRTLEKTLCDILRANVRHPASMPPPALLSADGHGQRFAVHVGWHRHAEQVQHGGADVHQPGVFSAGRLQNSTPGTSDGSMQWSPLQALALAWKTLPVASPDRRFPRGPIAALVTDDQVGSRCA